MLGQKHRFHGYGSLNFAYKKGRIVRRELASLKYVLNQRRRTYRLAVVVSRKVNNSAVARNRIRRRVYETFRSYETSIKQPYDLIFSVFSPTLQTLPQKQLNDLIKHILEEAKIIQS